MTRPDKLSRRSLLAAGLGLAAAYAVGCGDDDDAAETTPATSGTATATVSTSGTAAATPTPTTEPRGTIRARWGRLPSSDPSPAGRRDHSLVSVGALLYVFGGRTPAEIADGWMYDSASAQWVQLAAGPPARFGHNAVNDVPGNRMLVFGGQGAGFFNDTWEFSHATAAWTQIDAGSGPTPRYGSASALDPAGRMFVSHGFTNAGRFDDTWSWATSAGGWSDGSPAANRPLARCLTRGVWDSVNGRFLMFGGQSNPTPFLGDFWALGPEGWTELPGGPPPRNLYAMVFDDNTGRAILIGGAAENGNLNDVWVFDVRTNTWTQVTPEGEPPSPRASHDAVWQVSRNAVVVFGGFDGGYLNDLWQLEFI